MKKRIMVPQDFADIRARQRPGIIRPVTKYEVGRTAANKSADDIPEIALYGPIGWDGVTAGDFRNALNRVSGDSLRIRINSPGGDAFDGVAIYNDLVDWPGKVEVTVSGLAASAASIVAMAGDSLKMAQGSHLMIHRSWGIGMGDMNDMLLLASILESIDKSMADIYSLRTDTPYKDVLAMMSAETWFTAQEAVKAGFADAMLAEPAEQARFDLSGFVNPPKIDAGVDSQNALAAIERLITTIGV